MARPISIEDATLLDSAGAVLLRDGPSAFTLAKAAAHAGVSAATYVNRFGSKHVLLRRLSERWVHTLDAELAQAAAGQRTAVDRFRAVALHSYHDLADPATAANQLAALAIDLQHPELRALLHEGWGIVRRHLADHAAAALAAGELVGSPDPTQLARIVFTAMEGGCIAWSVHPEGSLITRLSGDLDALLSGWLPPPHDEDDISPSRNTATAKEKR